ncbi:hypothetical protein NKG05_04735 [Oerskovia sp. M15]
MVSRQPRVFAAGALALFPIIQLWHEQRILALALWATAGVLGSIGVTALRRRAQWHRVPHGAQLPAWATIGGAAFDAGLVILLTAVLTMPDGPRAYYPGAAIGRLATILAIIFAVLIFVGSVRSREVSRSDEVVALGVRLIGMIPAWLILDSATPSGMIVEQVLQCSVVGVGLVALGFGIRFLARRLSR